MFTIIVKNCVELQETDSILILNNTSSIICVRKEDFVSLQYYFHALFNNDD